MVIQELRESECLELLTGRRLARLACAHENQPYVIPVYLVYSREANCLYGFTTFGQKIEWMRTNPLVCVEVDEIQANDEWVSVIITGRFQELAESDASLSAGQVAAQRPRQVHETVTFENAENQHRPNDREWSENDRDHAWKALQTYAEWWEPAWAVWDSRDTDESYKPIYYRIRIDKITGHQAAKDPQSFRNWPKG